MRIKSACWIPTASMSAAATPTPRPLPGEQSASALSSSAGRGWDRRACCRQSLPARDALATVVFQQQVSRPTQLIRQVGGDQRLVIGTSPDRFGFQICKGRLPPGLFSRLFGYVCPNAGSRRFNVSGIGMKVSNFVDRTVERMDGLLMFGLHDGPPRNERSDFRRLLRARNRVTPIDPVDVPGILEISPLL